MGSGDQFDGPEQTQMVQPPQPPSDSPGSASTQLMPPDMQPPPAIPYTPPPSAADNPAAVGQQQGGFAQQPGGFDPYQGQQQGGFAQQPGGFDPYQGQQQGGFAQQPGGQYAPPFGGHPQQNFGFPGQQQGGFAQQPGGQYAPPFGGHPQQNFGFPGQPDGFGGAPPQPGYGRSGGAGMSIGGLLAGGVVALLGVVILILTFVEMADMGGYSSAHDRLDLSEFGLASPGLLWFYLVMMMIGALAAIAGGVLIALAGKLGAAMIRIAPIATTAGGALVLLFVILLWIGLTPSSDVDVEGGVPGTIVTSLALSVLVLAVGVLGMIPPTAPLFGLGNGRSGGPQGAGAFAHPGQQPGGFGQYPAPFGQPPQQNAFGQFPPQGPPSGGFGQPPQGPYGQQAQGPPSGGFGQPPQGPPSGGFGQPPQGPPSGGFGQPPQQDPYGQQGQGPPPGYGPPQQ
ncbi:hypothetical protein SAMN06265360_102110 [Haloechinothrix alba]|uniref:Uncharacterized protein n=2 Tax=Haloechinothrix alba TaxID=664784 RepID=A0A238VDA9_9PSEU|nr:hypothetical protein SAMN06265360_102110 [Haloechinothrix alba]